MVFIANFATFLSPSTVTVFSNCEQVRVSQNGRKLATQKPDEGHQVPHPPFTFRVGPVSQERSMLFSTGVARPGVEIGQIKAEGLIGGKVVATHTVRSPGVPTHLELAVDRAGRDLVADGSDWVRVYARICDARGTTYPYADEPVTFSVTGPGAVIGDATIGANPAPAEAGIATVLIPRDNASGDHRRSRQPLRIDRGGDAPRVCRRQDAPLAANAMTAVAWNSAARIASGESHAALRA